MAGSRRLGVLTRGARGGAATLLLGMLLALILFVALFGGFLTPYDPLQTDYGLALAPPSPEHWFGCDYLGRDVFSRVLAGARVTVAMSIVAALTTMVIGTVVGIVAGVAGGWVDSLLMRLSDTFMAFPEVVLGVAIVGVLGPSVANAVMAVCAVMWVRFARIARGLALAFEGSDFVFNARLSGCGWGRVLMRHVLPNVMPQMVGAMLLEIGYIMLTLASFSFLGLGVQPPTPEWGAMLSDGRKYFQTAPHLMLFPGLAILCTVVVFNLFGNTVSDRVSHPGR